MPSHTLSERLKNKQNEIENEKETEEGEEIKETEETPIDFLISMVQGFIKDPDSITTESLQDLLGGLQELREEESPMPEKEEMSSHKGGGEVPDLVIAIGRKIKENRGRK